TGDLGDDAALLGEGGAAGELGHLVLALVTVGGSGGQRTERRRGRRPVSGANPPATVGRPVQLAAARRPRGPPGPPSVRSVVAMSGLHLRRVAGPDGHDRPVRWVAVSELEDPTPFLDGGELLLSTGMRLPAAGAEAFDAFVRRLVEAEVAA